MNKPKIEKVITEIDKTKAKIAEYQAKLRELEREKIRLENEDIVALVRSERISDAELNALMESLRKRDSAAGGAASAQKLNKEETDSADIDKN